MGILGFVLSGCVHSKCTRADRSSGHHCTLGVNLGDTGYGTPQGLRRGRSDELPCQEPLAPSRALPGHLAANIVGRSAAVAPGWR